MLFFATCAVRFDFASGQRLPAAGSGHCCSAASGVVRQPGRGSHKGIQESYYFYFGKNPDFELSVASGWFEIVLLVCVGLLVAVAQVMNEIA